MQSLPGRRPVASARTSASRTGTIVAIGDGLDGDVLDATGAMLCPGFIDLHAHSALAPFDDPLLAPKILQGFTTEVICPDGLAPAPVADWRARRAYLRALEGDGPAEWPWSSFAEYLDALDATRPAMTLVPSVGHGAVRDFVVGGERVPPRLEEMRREVRLAFEAGARMLSFGLVYFPGAYADTDELVAVAEDRGRVRRAARAARPQRGPRRPRGGRGDDRGRTPLGCAAPPLAPEVARRRVADRAAARARRRRGRDVRPVPVRRGLDAARVAAAGVGAGGRRRRDARARTRPELRARIAHDVEHGLPGWENQLGELGPERIVVGGRTLAERGGDPVETVLDLLVETELSAQMIIHYASDEAVRTIAAHRLQLVGSDGIFGEHPHPRLYGTAPRFLGRFALREGLLPVEEAVTRLTARAADRLGLSDRGRIAVGQRADLVLLDPERYVDNATYDDPKRSPDGVLGVWVAGERVVDDGRVTGARPGGVLR